MDGILISSLGSVDRSWTKWSLMRGIDPAYAISTVHGQRAIESTHRLRPDLDPREELKIIEDFEVADTADIEVLPGVPEMLQALPPFRWTVVTSATERLARVRLLAADLPVPERFIHGDSVTEGKPHPAPFIAGAKLLGFDPQHCVVFEDSTAGVKAGRAAGCTVIATTFAHSPQQLHEAHYIVKNFDGIEVSVVQGWLELSFEPLQNA